MSPSKAWPKLFAASRWPGTAARNRRRRGDRPRRPRRRVVRKPAHDAFWGGYTGYFSDPDGHLWEVAYNPHFPLSDDGRLKLPD